MPDGPPGPDKENLSVTLFDREIRPEQLGDFADDGQHSVVIICRFQIISCDWIEVVDGKHENLGANRPLSIFPQLFSRKIIAARE
jgi:hypothetical protein